MHKVVLPKVFEDWIEANSAPSWVNNSREIHRKRITFLYTKFKKAKSEFWASAIEDYTGISYDYKNIDCVGNN
jgi:hypothetical protein